MNKIFGLIVLSPLPLYFSLAELFCLFPLSWACRQKSEAKEEMDAVRGLKGQFDKFTSAARPNSLVQAPLSGLLRGFYRSLFQKNTTFFTFILVGALGFEMLTGSIVDNVWNDLNKGVRIAYIYLQ